MEKMGMENFASNSVNDLLLFYIFVEQSTLQGWIIKNQS